MRRRAGGSRGRLDRRARRALVGPPRGERQATRMLAFAAALQTDLAASRRASKPGAAPPCGWACPRGRQPSSSARRRHRSGNPPQRPRRVPAGKQKHPYGGCRGARGRGGDRRRPFLAPSLDSFSGPHNHLWSGPRHLRQGAGGGGRRDGRKKALTTPGAALVYSSASCGYRASSRQPGGARCAVRLRRATERLRASQSPAPGAQAEQRRAEAPARTGGSAAHSAPWCHRAAALGATRPPFTGPAGKLIY